MLAARALSGTSADVLYYSTDTRIDALLIGCAASMIFMWKLAPASFFKSVYFDALACAATVAAAWVFFNTSHADVKLYTAYLPIFNISVAVLILWLLKREGSPAHLLLEIRPLRWIGKISYGLYLWHFLMYEFARETFSSAEMQIVVSLALAFVVSALSYYLIETPFLKLKSRFGG